MKPKRWQLQDAKNRLSHVVDQAQREGPQIITRRGVDAVVLISAEEWQRRTGKPSRLIDVLRRAPRVPGGLSVTRSADHGRDVDL
jgi:antitoxin Phd